MNGQLVLNITVNRKYLACKECGGLATKNGYCNEHQSQYYELKAAIDRERYNNQPKKTRYCKCGKELGFKKRYCSECAEANYKSKGLDPELKAIRDQKKNADRYEEGYFNPRAMKGIMIGYNEPTDYMEYKSEYGDFENSKVYKMRSNMVDLQHEYVKKVLRG